MSRRCVLVASLLAAGCPKPPADGDVAPTMATAAEQANAIEIYDELEALIADGADTEQDRQYALDRLTELEDDQTAAFAFARAAVLGRVAELRGVKAGKLVTQAETFARRSIERDPKFRDGAATRMLGSLYVMAPPRLVEHGDSEEGLELLEGLVESNPDDVVNHLRLAEAFIHLGDPEPGLPSLCRTLDDRDGLRADESALLDRLIADVGGSEVLQCAAEAADD